MIDRPTFYVTEPARGTGRNRQLSAWFRTIDGSYRLSPNRAVGNASDRVLAAKRSVITAVASSSAYATEVATYEVSNIRRPQVRPSEAAG